MPRNPEPIKMHVHPDELNSILDNYSDLIDSPAKARKAEKRITLVRMRYNGVPIEQCAQNLGITVRTCYNIQCEWNEKGPISIVPKASTGAKPKLSEDEIREIKAVIRNNSLTVKEASDYIKNNTKTQLSENQIRRVFRDDVKKLRNRK